MQYAAYWALLASLLCALGAGGWALHEAWSGKCKKYAWFETAQTVIAALTTGASVILVLGFVTRDFSFKYVAEYSDSFLPMFYAVTAFWAGQPGSLLFWMLCAALAGLAFQRSTAYAALSDATKVWFWIFHLGLEAFFLLLLTGPSNPFLILSPPPPDGNGLNPLLRNPGMIFHPPLLFLGYALFTVPCCLALASWLTGERVSWLFAARNHIITAWISLTAGVILGGWWAYMELGWGGYWAWDPVENSSLLPWLAGTAFLHTAIVEKRTGALPKTNVFLVSLTLLACFFGTYLVRSGVVDSVHAFGSGGVGDMLLIFIMAFFVLSPVVIWFGAEGRGEPARLSGLMSLPGFLVMLSWLLLAIALVVLLGTMWPVITSAFGAAPQGLDAGFYNRVCTPMFAVISLFVAFCPWMSWKQGFREPRTAAFLGGATLALMVVLYVSGVRVPAALIGASGGAAAFCGAVLLLLRDKAARNPKGPLAGHLVHAGLALVMIGVAFSGPYQTVLKTFLLPGKSVDVAGYTLTYKDLVEERTEGMILARAIIDVTRDGAPVGELAPERRMYRNFDQPFAEVSTIPSLGDEIYSTLLSFTKTKAISLQAAVNPLVNWIWIGGTLMCLGGFVGLRRFQRRKRSG